MEFKERLDSQKFMILAELQPPKGTELLETFEQIERLKGRVDAFNVPDLQTGVMRLGSLSACALMKSKGVEVVFNLSCGDRNRLALQSELLNASVLGLENILLLQGDPPSLGDHFESRAVFDLDVLGLLAAARRLQEGYDLSGNVLRGKPLFCTGTPVRASANGSLLESELESMEKKIGLGAEFFLTDSVYDLPVFESFIKKADSFGVPVVASVTLLKSVGMARYINQHVEGAKIPDAIINRLIKASDKQTIAVPGNPGHSHRMGKPDSCRVGSCRPLGGC
jgi:methylenetetrahydrofolate reductase (NADPH)